MRRIQTFKLLPKIHRLKLLTKTPRLRRLQNDI